MNYTILNTKELDSVNFDEVEETSENTLRYNNANTEFLLKFEGNTPSFLEGKTQYTHEEFKIIIDNVDGNWTADDATQGAIIDNLRDTISGITWDKVNPFIKMRNKVGGRWWLKGEEHNDELINFVNTWLNDWVGYVEETVFDVNMLSLDENTIICNNYNKKAFEFFKKHKVEPIVFNFRHRYFWDGGVHCITQDLYREGTMEDYFD